MKSKPQLEAILAYEDNYIWTLHDGQSALFVDPGEAEPILTWLAERRMHPIGILATHHHGDHVGGIPELLDAFPDLAVFGPIHDIIPGIKHAVGDGDVVQIAELDVTFQVMHIPGHTPGHVAYFGHGWLFCGDTLFSCGCGKVFGSSPALLHASLQRLAALPADTLVCCAHEYTLANIRFALTLDPDNLALLDWQTRARKLRQEGLPTLPTRLADELACNPFLRCQDAGLIKRLAELDGQGSYVDAASVFTAMRALKDRFR